MRNLITKRSSFFAVIFLCFFTALGVSAWFTNPFSISPQKIESSPVSPVEEKQEGKSVVVYLDTMKLELRDNARILATLPLISQGKPGSYYETIGGTYRNDYKIPLHFSSIGHVYMPYSVHLFGNYFIHGIPYYPNGEQVASTYSGGCIRLSDENAKLLYDFIERGTPITITKDSELSFLPTEIASTTMSSIDLTNLMVATISLETLTQDNPIRTDDGTMTTRKNLLPKLISHGDASVAYFYARDIGEDTFIELMNQKAESIGLTNTHFNDFVSPVATTYEDYTRFMIYITTYKSYLRTTDKSLSISSDL